MTNKIVKVLDLHTKISKHNLIKIIRGKNTFISDE